MSYWINVKRRKEESFLFCYLAIWYSTAISIDPSVDFRWSEEDLNDDGNYVHFLDNHQTRNHHSIIYGIRQMNEFEMNKFCAIPISERSVLTESCHFTSDYRLRVYQSTCLYLDENNQWKADGLIVSGFFLDTI